MTMDDLPKSTIFTEVMGEEVGIVPSFSYKAAASGRVVLPMCPLGCVFCIHKKKGKNIWHQIGIVWHSIFLSIQDLDGFRMFRIQNVIICLICWCQICWMIPKDSHTKKRMGLAAYHAGTIMSVSWESHQGEGDFWWDPTKKDNTNWDSHFLEVQENTNWEEILSNNLLVRCVKHAGNGWTIHFIA